MYFFISPTLTQQESVAHSVTIEGGHYTINPQGD
jgi:hypothetical protein